MKVRKEYADPDSGKEPSTNGLTLVSGLFIIFIVGSLLLVSAITNAIREDVAWTAPDSQIEQQADHIAQTQYSRARLANVPDQLTNADEIEREKIQKGEMGREEIRGGVVSDLLDSLETDSSRKP